MNWTVLSRRKAKEFSYTPLQNPLVIISITDIEAEPVAFARNLQIKAVLRLFFDDVDRGESGAMDGSDADRIVEFCQNWLPQSDLLVHCEAGVSRSAGVCAAILKWFEGSDMPIFEDARYRPNMHCYREVLNAFVRNTGLNSENEE